MVAAPASIYPWVGDESEQWNMERLRVLGWAVLVVWLVLDNAVGKESLENDDGALRITGIEEISLGLLRRSLQKRDLNHVSRTLQKRDLGELDDSLVAASHHWSHGGGSEHHSDHHSKHGKKADKGYHGHHHHDHGKKGHHDKEAHSGHYSEHGGHKKKHHDEGGYHKV